MSWWLVAYVAVLVVWTGAGAVADLKDREPLWYTGGGLLSGAADVLGCAAWSWPEVAAALGLALPAGLISSAVWIGITVPLEVRRERESPPPLGKCGEAIAIALSFLLLAPAWVLGGIAWARTLGSG